LPHGKESAGTAALRREFMRIAIVTFEGFNEIDSFVAFHILNRVTRPGWKAEITAPQATLRSGNGVAIHAQRPLEFANEADAVLFGSGRQTRQVVEDASIMQRLKLDPARQLIASQCSGALVLAKLGLLRTLPVCTDLKTRPMVEAAGARVLEQTFFADGNVASAGGCLGSTYLATWILWRLLGREAAHAALEYVAPVGELEQYVLQALGMVAPHIFAQKERAAVVR
jgi:transcriptional regulator GlxA family with amidase domain